MADGTTNFVHGFPYACISLGLIDQRVSVLGVIYNPFLEHLYTGVRGAGSFLHTRISPTTSSLTPPQRLPLAPASARPLPALAGALLAVEWGSDRAREPIRSKSDSFSRLAGAPPYGVMAHSLRSVGSAALNFALVAQGALDMYWCVRGSNRCIISEELTLAGLDIGRLDAGACLLFFPSQCRVFFNATGSST
jgi:myo-inositol-1(or 4)-monophosphatase